VTPAKRLLVESVVTTWLEIHWLHMCQTLAGNCKRFQQHWSQCLAAAEQRYRELLAEIDGTRDTVDSPHKSVESNSASLPQPATEQPQAETPNGKRPSSTVEEALAVMLPGMKWG
jgi:hypothetical protein